ncbi:MAG: hypothetical protein EOP83_09715 [Verrucomicrobiaceae bacterium]|nr:MAG: hypothetical protein EOP83_09715 [Verrucomicrobiaceae bacterium]
MNPSEDPNDRLVDSLLRESVRGGADTSLLESIAAKLDAAPMPVRSSRPSLLPWLVAAACLTILGVTWALWHRDGARGGKSSPHPVVESGAPAPTATPGGGSQSPKTRPPSAASRDATEVLPVPVPVPSGDVAVTRTPEPAEDEPQMNPSGGGSQTLRDFAERRLVMAGEGMRVRGLSFPADPTLTEVFVYDLEAPEETPPTRIDVSTHLGGAGQFLSLKGDRVVLSDLGEQPLSQGDTHVFGSLKIAREATDGIFMLLPGSGKAGDPARRAMFLDMSPKVVPPGSVLVMNLSPWEVRLQLEGDLHRLKPGEQEVIKGVPLGPNGLTSVNGFRQKGAEMQRIFAAAWPAHGAFRSIQIFYDNPQSQMTEVRGFRDRIPQVDALGGGERKEENADALDGLAYVRDESTMWYVQFGLESSGKWAPRFVGLTPDKKTKLQNRVSAVEMLKPGDTFFKEGVFEGRFKFVGFEDREIRSERTGLTQSIKFALYEELKPNKKGMRYESQAGLPDAELEAKAYYDRTAVLKFGEQEVRVEEYTKFRLPGNASKMEHFLKKVTPQRVTIETMGAEGKVITRVIQKGTP